MSTVTNQVGWDNQFQTSFMNQQQFQAQQPGGMPLGTVIAPPPQSSQPDWQSEYLRGIPYKPHLLYSLGSAFEQSIDVLLQQLGLTDYSDLTRQADFENYALNELFDKLTFDSQILTVKQLAEGKHIQ